MSKASISLKARKFKSKKNGSGYSRNMNELGSIPSNTKEEKATPFVKWVGGKRSIIEELTNRLPETFENYYEPFVGGGALFFEIYKRAKKNFLSDVNVDLVYTYNVIKENVDLLIKELKVHERKHSEEYYYKVRNLKKLRNHVNIAARFLYLNKTCYNGLYRVNSKDEFNTPIGSYENPNIVSEDNLRACNVALKNVSISLQYYHEINPGKNDFVYFDPPYHPVNETSFVAYHGSDFSEKDQESLRDFIIELHKKGVKVMLSNSNTSFIQKLYSNNIFKKNIVLAPRIVNSKADGRSDVEELIITNY